jgi:hypothetical protein
MAKIIIPNQSFIELLKDINQTVVIDANLIIPPDRSNLTNSVPRIGFDKYKNIFIEPMLRILPNIAIHEAVYSEISVQPSLKDYIDLKIQEDSIILLKDSDLNDSERFIRNTIEEKIAQFTKYNPSLNNSSDRGEVKSISFAVAKNLIYFSTNDSNVISLIERRELEPYLHSLGAIRLYELIYLIKINKGNSKALRGLYKLLYYLTTNEKEHNLDWASFIEECNRYYAQYFDGNVKLSPRSQK